VSTAIAGIKIKLDEEAITEVLVADTESESGSEARDIEDYCEEEEKEEQQRRQEEEEEKKKNRLQQVVDYQPGDCLKEGTQIFILSSDQQKV
jgi:hypothetical protein